MALDGSTKVSNPTLPEDVTAFIAFGSLVPLWLFDLCLEAHLQVDVICL